MLALSSLLALTPLMGCDSEGDESTEDRQERQVEEREIDHLVVFGQNLEITIDDVMEAVDRTRLLAPEAPEDIPSGEPQWMEQPQAQIGLVRNLVRAHIVRQAAAARDISLTPHDELETIREHPQLSSYLPLFEDSNGDEAQAIEAKLDEVDLSVDDVRSLVHDAALEERLTDALTDDVDEEMLWPIYRAARDEIDLLVIDMRSTPSSQEIEQALSTYDREIRAYYRDHRDQFDRELDRPLRREIASQLLREIEGITPSNQQRAEEAQQLLEDLAEDEPIDDAAIKEAIQHLSDHGFDAHRTQPFSLRGAQVVPGVGLAEEFFAQIQELSFEEPVTEPVLDRNRILLARIVDRGQADRDQFDDEYEEFRVEFVEANRSRLLNEYIRKEQLERDINFHFAALTEVFGHAQKPEQVPEEPVPLQDIPDGE